MIPFPAQHVSGMLKTLAQDDREMVRHVRMKPGAEQGRNREAGAIQRPRAQTGRYPSAYVAENHLEGGEADPLFHGNRRVR